MTKPDVRLSGMIFGAEGAWLTVGPEERGQAAFVGSQADAHTVLGEPLRSRRPQGVVEGDNEQPLLKFTDFRPNSALALLGRPGRLAIDAPSTIVRVPISAAPEILELCESAAEHWVMEADERRPPTLPYFYGIRLPNRKRPTCYGMLGYADMEGVPSVILFFSKTQAEKALARITWFGEPLMRGYHAAIADCSLPMDTDLSERIIPAPFAGWLTFGMAMQFVEWFTVTYGYYPDGSPPRELWFPPAASLNS